MPDYLPRGGAELSAFAENLFAKTNPTPANYGLTAANVVALGTAKDKFKSAFDDNVDKQIAAGSSRILKDDEQDALEDLIRALVRIIQANPATTNEMRGDLMITIPDTTATPAPAPDSLPMTFIDTVTPLRHEIVFSSEESKGKPEGVRALEIWHKIGGTATGNEADYQFLAQDTDSPYIKQFQAADSGKQIHYLFCWVNSAGERGPWKMMSATATSELQSDV